MQSDPQDGQWTLPDSRDGEPREPAGDDQPVSREAQEAGAPPPAGAGVPPRTPDGGAVGQPQMPRPPQMPGAPPPGTAWGGRRPPPETPDVGPVDVFPAAATERPERTDRALAEAADAARHDEPARAVEAGESGGPDEPRAGLSEGPGSPSHAATSEFVPPPRTSVAPSVQGDWLASVCPYLASEDGTYRSAAPDPGHRCTAQDPPATLPLAFQERFCLTDRHPRCEMYKYAQGLGPGTGVVAAAEDPAVGIRRRDGASSAGGVNRSLVAGVAGLGGVVVLVFVLVVLMGSCAGEPGGGDAGSPDPQASAEPQASPTPRPTPTPGTPRPTQEPAAGATEPATPTAAAGSRSIRYEIQEGEALLKVADTFGVTRRRLWRANPGLEDVAPADLPGLVITVPVSPDIPLEEVEVLPGYLGPAEDA